MGRALFSQTYRQESSPAVRTQPEPVVDTICQKWSVWNKFDPDSDEFFVDAEYEAFLDPEELRQQQVQEALQQARVPVEASSDSSSDSSDNGASDAGSPMATGLDDPAALIAEAYSTAVNDTDTDENEAEWQALRVREANTAAAEWLDGIAAANSGQPVAIGAEPSRSTEGEELTGNNNPARSYRPTNRPRSASAAPPSLVPLSTQLSEQEAATTTTTEQQQAPSPSVVRIATPSIATPVILQVEHGNSTPLTPQRRNVRGQTQTIVSPSPPPSVTPRYYSWQNHPIPALPTSPTRIRGNRDGPLTNPHARRSFARLGSAQAPVLLSNTAN